MNLKPIKQPIIHVDHTTVSDKKQQTPKTKANTNKTEPSTVKIVTALSTRPSQVSLTEIPKRPKEGYPLTKIDKHPEEHLTVIKPKSKAISLIEQPKRASKEYQT